MNKTLNIHKKDPDNSRLAQRISKGKENSLKINLGSGTDLKPGYVNVDIVKIKGIGKVHDLNKYPYPFKANEAEEIIAEHIIEHLNNPLEFLEEAYRILKSKGILKIETPHHASGNAYADLTHKNFFNLQAFKNITQNKSQISNEEVKIKKFNFRIKKAKMGLERFKFLEPIINKFNKAYDYGFCYLLRPGSIFLELEAIK